MYFLCCQSEVNKLEKTLKSAPKGTTAYLVPDAPALCSQLHLIRRLVTMEKFLIIIPIQGNCTLCDSTCNELSCVGCRSWNCLGCVTNVCAVSCTCSVANILANLV